VRILALLIASAMLCGCAVRPLPPLSESPTSVTKGSDCHGLDTAFRWTAIRVGGDKADEYSRLRWGYRFINMFGLVGHTDLNYKKPAYAKAVYEPDSSALRLVFYGEEGIRLAETRFPHTRVLECGPKQSRLSFDDAFSSAESGRTVRRLTITFTNATDVARIHTRVEAEHAWLVFRSAKQWEYWGDFEYDKPAN